MFRSLVLFITAAFFVSSLAGCIFVDGHPRGGHIPPGQLKKMHW
jgi:hypothetical protein